MRNLLAFLKELIPVVLIAATSFIGYFLFEFSARVFFDHALENPTSNVLLAAFAIGLVGYLIYILGIRLWRMKS